MLICAFSIFEGVVRPLRFDEVRVAPQPEPGEIRWYHMDRMSVEVRDWLLESQLVPDFAHDALFQEESRPRAFAHEGGLVLNLRGVNMSEGAEPEDLVSLRIYATESYLITTRASKLQAGEDLIQKLGAGFAPKSVGPLVTYLTVRMTELLEPVVQKLEDEVDRLEDDMLNDQTPPPKLELAQFRRAVLSLRRYILPQRQAVSDLIRLGDPVISKADLLDLRETQDVITRLSEHLDMIRERAIVVQEQIVELRAEAMNQRLFVLAIISAVFLPLGFITGLFGVNIGGMPGVQSGYAFWGLCGAMLVLVLGLMVLFKKMKWL